MMKPTAATDTGETGQARCKEAEPVKILHFHRDYDIEQLRQDIKDFAERMNKPNYIVKYTSDNKIEHIKRFDDK